MPKEEESINCENCLRIDEKTGLKECEVTGNVCEEVEELLSSLHNAEPEFAEVPYPEHKIEYIMAHAINNSEWVKDLKYMPEAYKQALCELLESDDYLTERQRVCLHLKYVDGLPFSKIAKLMRKFDDDGNDIGHVHWTAVRASVIAGVNKLRRYILDQSYPAYRKCAHEFCEVEFRVANPTSTRKYCNDRCRWAAAKLRRYRKKQAQKPKKVQQAINCKNPLCNILFVPSYGNQVYHSKKCRTDHYNEIYIEYQRPWLNEDGTLKARKKDKDIESCAKLQESNAIST